MTSHADRPANQDDRISAARAAVLDFVLGHEPVQGSQKNSMIDWRVEYRGGDRRSWVLFNFVELLSQLERQNKVRWVPGVGWIGNFPSTQAEDNGFQVIKAFTEKGPAVVLNHRKDKR